MFGVDNDGDGDVDATDFFLFVWQSARRAYKEHRVRINCFVALAVWLLVGIVFGLFNQGWTFVTSLYFAVSSLSTGGLQGVNTRVTDAGVTLLTGKGGNALVSGSRAVTVRVTTEETLAVVRERLGALGAEHLINYKTHANWGEQAFELTGHAGVDLVVEVGGPDNLPQSISALARANHILESPR